MLVVSQYLFWSLLVKFKPKLNNISKHLINDHLQSKIIGSRSFNQGHPQWNHRIVTAYGFLKHSNWVLQIDRKKYYGYHTSALCTCIFITTHSDWISGSWVEVKSANPDHFIILDTSIFQAPLQPPASDSHGYSSGIVSYNVSALVFTINIKYASWHWRARCWRKKVHPSQISTLSSSINKLSFILFIID